MVSPGLNQGNNHFPRPADSALPSAAQEAAGIPCCKGTLLAHAQPCVCHHAKVLFCCQAASQTLGPQLLLVHGVIPAQVQDFVLAFAELYEVPVCTFLQPANVPLTHLLYHALPQVIIFVFLFIPMLRFGSTAR